MDSIKIVSELIRNRQKYVIFPISNVAVWGRKILKSTVNRILCITRMHYYRYKLHEICGLSKAIHSFDLIKRSVHYIHYLKDVKDDQYQTGSTI